MKTCYGPAAGLLVAPLLLASAPAHALSAVDCATVDLDFADAKAAKTCKEGDISSKTWHGTEQEMRAEGKGYFLYVRQEKAGFRSHVRFLEERDIAAAIGQDVFVAPVVIAHDTVLVVAHDTFAAYDIALVSGRLQAEPKRALDCFFFSRYGGWNNKPGGVSGEPGYDDVIYGGYCTSKGISDSTIERVLGELRAPLEQPATSAGRSYPGRRRWNQ
jgi:hypothetical protein